VGAADLGDRIVAVADEDAFVEVGRAFALVSVERPAAFRHLGCELLEVEAPQGSGITRVAGEKGAFHRLREVGQRKNRPVDVGEMRCQELLFGRGE
jgi:hypothetical protein